MKNNDGFTLLEVVISIAALSVISVFILQMFISSANLNARAKNTDIAMTVAISEIENLKSYSSLSEYLLADDTRTVSENSDILTVSLYYDKDWNQTNIAVPAGAKYYLKMDITPESESPSQKEGVTYGVLCAVKADITEMSSGENGRMITSLQTKKYFPDVFEEGR